MYMYIQTCKTQQAPITNANDNDSKQFVRCVCVIRFWHSARGVQSKGGSAPLPPLGETQVVLMIDERMSEGQTNKAKQHNTPKAVTFS